MKSTKSCLAAIAVTIMASCTHEPMTVSGGSELISFVGRTDRTTPEMPKQWAAGGYFTFAFEGDKCVIDLNDEQPDGNNRNIIEVVVDDSLSTICKTKGISNRIVITSEADADLSNDSTMTVFVCPLNKSLKRHHVTVCRDSETAMGYTQLVSVMADEIFKWEPSNGLRIEFIGNSITCGAEADTTLMERSLYNWGDWHRAYVGYGPRTARALNAQWSLVSVSGIGLIHSCCDMDVTMPKVYDKIILRNNQLSYDFSYQPDIICSCLGQNDGIQDSAAFCTAYVDFIKTVKGHNPQAKIVLLSSPMDHGKLNTWLCGMLTSIAERLKSDGLDDISCYFYSRAWNAGGADHPSVEEHAQIAEELTNYLKTIL